MSQAELSPSDFPAVTPRRVFELTRKAPKNLPSVSNFFTWWLRPSVMKSVPFWSMAIPADPFVSPSPLWRVLQQRRNSH